MFHHSARRLVPGFLLTFAAFSFAQAPQDTPAASEAVQRANSTLTAGAENSQPPTALTHATLVQRHEKLIELFRTNPEKARGLMLSSKTRAWLLKADASNAALLEEDRPLTGQLVSSTADDFVNHTSSKHYTLHTFHGDRVISFAATQPTIERFAGRQVTVTGVSIPEAVAVETVRKATTEESTSANQASLSVAPQAEVAAVSSTPLPFIGSGVPPGAATALGTTLGNQTTAVLILKFAAGTAAFPTGWDQPAVYDQMFNGPATPNIAAFMKEGSYGQTTVAADIYGPITLPGDYNCNTVDAMANAAVAATASSIDYTKYHHITFMFPAKTCYFGGLANNGEQLPTALIPHQYSYTWIEIGPDYNFNTDFYTNFAWLATNHEFGHNLNLNHGNSLDFGPLTLGPIDYVSVNPGTVTPGGHAPADTQTVPTADAPAAAPDVALAAPTGSTKITAVNTEYGEKFANMGDGQAVFSAQHATQELNWIPASGTKDITSSGSFTLLPTETSSGLRSLHVLRDPTSSSWVWIEFHQPLQVYTPLAFTRTPYNVSNDVLSGAQLHYQDGFAEQQHTLLMDMSPASTPNDFFHSNLLPGASWSDPFSLLTITTGTQSANSLNMLVSYDTPCAMVALDSPTAPTAGGTGSVTVTAPSTCSWSVSSNAPWITFPGTVTGTGNGTVNFVSAANTSVAQRNSYITAQRQSLPIVQPGTGISLLNRAPVSAAVGQFVPLVFNITDNLGFADLSEVDITIRGGTQPDCVVTASAASDSTGKLANSIFLNLAANGISLNDLSTGTPGTLSNAYCTIDVGNSVYSANGKNATLTIMASFPGSYVGTHSVYGVGYGSTNGVSVPLSYVNVTAAAASASAAISPVSSTSPAAGNAAVVPFTINGTATGFTANSTVQISGAGVSVTKLNFVDAKTLTGQFSVSPKAASGARIVTVSTGPETVATVFTVVAAGTAAITLSPTSGKQDAKVPITITGSSTAFTAASIITISGAGVNASQVTYVSPTALTALITIKATADTNQRTLTVTTGTAVVAAYFTVIPADVPHVVASPSAGNQGDSVDVTFIGTDTNFGDTSVITIPGTDIKVKDVNALSTTLLSAKLTMTSTATASARVVTITTGTEVVKGTFTVTAYTPTTTSITAVDEAIKETNPATLVVTVVPASGSAKPLGYVSFLEKKGGSGLEDVLATVALSGGTATLSVPNLSVGVHTFYAQYLGDNSTFAASNSTVNAKVTVKADAGTVVLAETATLQMLTDGSYEAIVTIANSGAGTAKKVQMTSATLGGVSPAQAFPVALPDIAPGGSISALFDFPASAATPGGASVLKFAGVYTGGNFSGSTRVAVPSASH